MLKALFCYFFHKEFKERRFLGSKYKIFFCNKCKDYRTKYKRVPLL